MNDLSNASICLNEQTSHKVSFTNILFYKVELGRLLHKLLGNAKSASAN